LGVAPTAKNFVRSSPHFSAAAPGYPLQSFALAIGEVSAQSKIDFLK